MTSDGLAKIRARADAASEGPWTCQRDNGITIETAAPGAAYLEVAHVPDETENPRDLCDRNAVFIAHARADVPTLCDEIARLRGLLRLGDTAARIRGLKTCLFCSASSKTPIEHDADCPAFTPTGEVR